MNFKIYKLTSLILNMTANKAEIKKTIEYYLSDKNLANESFFSEKIKANKEVSTYTEN